MNKRLKKFLQIAFAILFWVGVWALLSYRINETLLLPTPKEVFLSLVGLVKGVDFWLICLRSFARILYGIIFAVVLGIILSIITVKINFLDILITPVMSAVKATPVASFIILAILWFDRNDLPIFITVLIVLPIVWTNVSAGIRSVDGDLVSVADIYRFNFGKRLRFLYLPSVMPYFFAACRSALGMAWKAGIAAEVLCTPQQAIGTELYFSKTYLDTCAMFGWTLVIIVLSFVIEKIFIFLISKLSAKLCGHGMEVRI